MKVTLHCGEENGPYLFEHVDWVQPMNDAHSALQSTAGRGLCYSPRTVRIVLIEPDDNEKGGDA